MQKIHSLVGCADKQESVNQSNRHAAIWSVLLASELASIIFHYLYWEFHGINLIAASSSANRFLPYN